MGYCSAAEGLDLLLTDDSADQNQGDGSRTASQAN